MGKKYDIIIVGGGPAGIFAAGDGAGVSRGLSMASASGVVAACEILRRSGY